MATPARIAKPLILLARSVKAFARTAGATLKCVPNGMGISAPPVGETTLSMSVATR
jgi:hypothetical protein